MEELSSKPQVARKLGELTSLDLNGDPASLSALADLHRPTSIGSTSGSGWTGTESGSGSLLGTISGSCHGWFGIVVMFRTYDHDHGRNHTRTGAAKPIPNSAEARKASGDSSTVARRADLPRHLRRHKFAALSRLSRTGSSGTFLSVLLAGGGGGHRIPDGFALAGSARTLAQTAPADVTSANPSARSACRPGRGVCNAPFRVATQPW